MAQPDVLAVAVTISVVVVVGAVLGHGSTAGCRIWLVREGPRGVVGGRRVVAVVVVCGMKIKAVSEGNMTY